MLFGSVYLNILGKKTKFQETLYACSVVVGNPFFPKTEKIGHVAELAVLT